MPLKLNVGLSRKIGEQNYGSRGASVNLEMELESGLVTEPSKLLERIRQLFTMVRSSLAEELNGNGNGNGNGHAGNGNGKSQEPHTNGGNGGNGNGASAPKSNSPRPATQSQIKAIYAIARNQRLDLTGYLRSYHGIEKPEDLDIKNASQVIDALKNGKGG